VTKHAVSIIHVSTQQKGRETDEVGGGGSGYLGGAQLHAAVEAAEHLLMLLEPAGLGSSHAEAAGGAGGPSEAGGLVGGGGGGGGQVGGGGALHLLHAVVTTVIVVHHVNLHGRNSACPDLYIMRYESEWNLVLPSSLVKKMKQ